MSTTIYRLALLATLNTRGTEARRIDGREVAAYLATTISEEGGEVTYQGCTLLSVPHASVIVRFRAATDDEAARIASSAYSLPSMGGLLGGYDIENLSTGRGAKRRTITLEDA